MNYGTMKTLVTRNLGGRDDLAVYVPEWINSTYMDLVTKGKFVELQRFAPIPVPALDGEQAINTVVDQVPYTLPSDFLFPISVRNVTENYALKPYDIRTFERKRSDVSGRPYRYTTYGGVLLLDPPPDEIYALNMKYRKKLVLPVLTSDSHIPVVGEEWHECIVLGATYRGAYSLSYPDAQRWKDEWKTFIIEHSEQTTEEEEDADIGFSFSF